MTSVASTVRPGGSSAMHQGSWPLSVYATAGLVVMGLAVGLSVVAAYTNHTTAVRNGASATSVLTHGAVEEGQVSLGTAYRAQVDHVRRLDMPDPAFQVASGHHLIAVTVHVTNTSKRDQYFWPVNQSFIRDARGSEYLMHPSVFLSKPYQAGVVTGGATVEGELTYDVEDDATGLRLFLDPAWDTGLPAVINLRSAL
jgi:Domain of unknown function (DUF4352)